MVLVTWFVTVWGGALLWLARLARRAPCGPGHARTGRALFALLLIMAVFLGVAAPLVPSRPLTPADYPYVAWVTALIPVSGWSAVLAYLKRAAECDA
ncbi:MAG TPA: hypothetical protein ENJ85_02780 [Oceanithermus profundus]|uniref:Uncharacterized protein n=2 Tax=Oceanithermus TaxID=208447 RepID=A0A7C5WW53_9DEIN|nr:hypothetical protein [Oceanithermus profundus]